MKIDLEALEAKARAATPGPWMRLFGERTVYDRMEDGCRGNPIVRADQAYREQDAANLDFIAAVGPTTILAMIERLRAAEAAPKANDVEWVVNDMGELGVRVAGQCYFCYKGGSLVYEDGLHDEGQPILHRNVGKREFGETVVPAAWWKAGRTERRYTQELTYTPGLSDGPADNPKYQWLPLPVGDGK